MSLLIELKRRNVFRVGIAYAVLSWLLLQVTDVVVPILGLPDWVARLVLFLLLIGLPIVIFFAWAYELTPEGIKRESDVDRSRSITPQTGRKLDRAIIVVLAVALSWFAWDRFRPAEAPSQMADAQPVIAVLPFKATGSEDGGFLAAGLHDDLLTKLAKLGAYTVISRTSMAEYADTTKNMRQIGDELGAGYILEGGVQARGSTVRINAQLIYAPDDEHVWAETYDRELTVRDLFDIQAELAMAIADATHTTLSPEDRAVVENVPTEDLEAYSAYLRGLSLRMSTGGVGGQPDRDAVAAFGEAVRLDPDFAQAWAWLAAAHARIGGNEFDQEASDAALAALDRARELRPDLLEADLAWAEYLYRKKQEFAQAYAVLNGLGEQVAGDVNALSLKAYLSRRLGRFDEGFDILQSVWRLEPRNPKTYWDLIGFALALDDCESARRHADTLLAIAYENPAARGAVARYELECNGDGPRAAELVSDGEFAWLAEFPIVMISALSARDPELLADYAEAEWTDAGPATPFWREITLWNLYTHLQPDPVLAGEALDRAAILIEEYAAADGIPEAFFAEMQRTYLSARGDLDGTLEWSDEKQRLLQNVYKGDALLIAGDRLFKAWSLAQVGADNEAIAVIRTMLEEPAGSRFPLVEVLPAFDGLRDHPDYIALRDEFGN